MRDFRDRIDWIEKPSKEVIQWALARLKKINSSKSGTIPNKEQSELPPSGDGNSLTDKHDYS